MRTKIKIDRAIEICPEEKPDPFNFGLSERKAIYLPQEGQFPKLPVIDMTLCTRCGHCEEESNIVNLSEKPTELEIQVGAVIVSIGFDPYQPNFGEYGYGKAANIITLPEFKRMVESGYEKLAINGKEVQTIAYIYCVGSRQLKGENKYCSRYCCTASIHAALLVKSNYPNIKNFHINRGIRTYGKHEILYQQSCEQGDVYLQTTTDTPPEVVTEGTTARIWINDLLTQGKPLELEADLVVLVTGMEPKKGNKMTEILKVPAGRDRFFNEVHPKLRPVETVIDGVYIAGACQAPLNIPETVKSALSAAVKAHGMLRTGEIALEPTLARIDAKACMWCGECQAACPYDAIIQREENGKSVAEVSISNCKGCGMCLPVCAENAIDLAGYTDHEIESMIDVLAEG